MTKQEAIDVLSGRVSNAAAYIRSHPQNFAVCEGCERVVPRLETFCPYCNAYRFDYRYERVLERATFCTEHVEERFATIPRLEEL